MIGNFGSLKKQICILCSLCSWIHKCRTSLNAVLSKMLVDPSLQDWYLYLMVVLADKVTLVQKYKNTQNTGFL